MNSNPPKHLVAFLLSAGCVLSSLWVRATDAQVEVMSAAEAQQSIVVNTDGCHRPETVCVLPQDEIWIIHIESCTAFSESDAHDCIRPDCCEADRCQNTGFAFTVRQLVDSKWQDSDLQRLYQSHRCDPSHASIVLAHGNNTNESWAITRGMQFYKHILYHDGHCRMPIRLIVLDWPSDRVLKRPLPDYKLKSKLAVNLGADVAAILQPFGDRRPLLVGYSLGAQLILSAVQSGSDTSFNEPVDGDPSCATNGYRVSIIAPALDGEFAGRYLADLCHNPVIERAIVFENHRDRLVCASRFLARRTSANSTRASSFLELEREGYLDSTPFEFEDITTEVRPRHSLVNYAKSPSIKQKTLDLLQHMAVMPVDPMVPQ